MQGLDAAKVLVAGTACAALAAVALAARSDVPTASAGGAGVQETPIATLNEPTYLQRAPGEPDLLFVTKREGEIKLLNQEQVRTRPFLDINDRVRSAGGEQGLLSLAFHPDYKKNRRFYVYFTNNSGKIEVDEYKRKKRSSFRASEASRRRVIVIPHPDHANHNGGTVAFGENGHMWLATGDGGGANDAEDNARDKSSLLGKVLRIEAFKPGDPSKPGYKVPTQNPFVGKPGRDEIWGYGFRNPFRFSFDNETNTIAIADVGQDQREEVDLVEIRPNRGGNFGWPRYEGSLEVDPTRPGAPGDPLIEPMHEYAHPLSGPVAVTGGIVVRDPELPALVGRYLFADFYEGSLQSFQPDLANNEADDLQPAGVTIAQPVAFASGVGGQLYVVSLAGPVYRLEPAP